MIDHEILDNESRWIWTPFIIPSNPIVLDQMFKLPSTDFHTRKQSWLKTVSLVVQHNWSYMTIFIYNLLAESHKFPSSQEKFQKVQVRWSGRRLHRISSSSTTTRVLQIEVMSNWCSVVTRSSVLWEIQLLFKKQRIIFYFICYQQITPKINFTIKSTRNK